MYTERRAIEDEIHIIKRQMEFLWDRLSDLRKRLREIDERDMNETVSYDALTTLTSELTKVINKLSDLVPSVNVEQVLDHVSKDINKEQVITPNEAAKPSSIMQVKIEQAAKDQQAQAYTPPMKISRERAASIIKDILMDAGGPMKFKAIEREFFNRTNKRFANFYEQMKFASEQFPSIKKIGRGLYNVIDDTADNSPVNVEEVEEEKQIRMA